MTLSEGSTQRHLGESMQRQRSHRQAGQSVDVPLRETKRDPHDEQYTSFAPVCSAVWTCLSNSASYRRLSSCDIGMSRFVDSPSSSVSHDRLHGALPMVVGTCARSTST
eukprot:gb/GFBE01039484.1/.p1 GENE.gb/GFBE01039484.1/~~gb/GFBE01039484.1/.p1  ORF type:complete len:109 (+),score=4.60 gb/GFBE01039484.1/:1-327(+)